MTYLGHCDLERSIAPPPIVQYSYIVTKRALLSFLRIFFNENLKKSYIIQNLNIIVWSNINFKSAKSNQISNFSMVKWLRLATPCMQADLATYNLQAAICFRTARNSQNAIRDFS